ncbi:MAG TPA: B-box zinc finger protein [Bacilli bacterium]|nr:B-box zinc finger protein [Bacilli bacterium]
MNCKEHPDRPVARECRVCHELICSECVVPVGEHAVCKSCVAESLVIDERGLNSAAAAKRPAPINIKKSSDGSEPQAERQQEKALHVLKTKRESMNAGFKSGFLTILFSCLPGLGHYYLGMQKRGLNLMILFFLIIFLNTIVPNALQFPLAIAIPILWFYSQFDALKYRTMINDGETVEDVPLFPQLARLVTASSFGWILAAIGVIALLNSVLNLVPYDYQLREAMKDVVMAIVLFVAGFWILKGKPLPNFTQSTSRQTEESEDRNHA